MASPWGIAADAVVRWEAGRDSEADRKVLRTLWTAKQLEERGDADRGFWAGELLDAIRVKYDGGGRATDEQRARARSVDAALERALDAIPPTRRARNGRRKATPTAVELEFATGSDAREFRRLVSLFDGRVGVPAAPDQYHEYVLPDAPEHMGRTAHPYTPGFQELLRSCEGKIVRQARMTRPNGPYDATMVTPFEPPSPYRVVIVTMHQSGPKQTIIECDYSEQAVEAAERERGRQTNRRDNAVVRVDAAKDGRYRPRVQWTFRGEWKREMQ